MKLKRSAFIVLNLITFILSVALSLFLALSMPDFNRMESNVTDKQFSEAMEDWAMPAAVADYIDSCHEFIATLKPVASGSLRLAQVLSIIIVVYSVSILHGLLRDSNRQREIKQLESE